MGCFLSVKDTLADDFIDLFLLFFAYPQGCIGRMYHTVPEHELRGLLGTWLEGRLACV